LSEEYTYGCTGEGRTLVIKRKMVLAITLTLLLMSMLTLAFNIQPVKAEGGTIYIRADGSIDGQTAPIQLDYSTSSTPPSIEWNKTYGGIYDDLANDGHQVNDGGYIVTGENCSYGKGYWAWLFKTDGYGNSQWEKHYVIGEDTHANSVVQTGDGGYILAGFVKWPDDYEDALLIKTDSHGNIQWDKTYGGLLTYERANSVVQTNDGGYIFAGYMREPDLGVTSLWLLKTDSSGNVQWGQKCGGLGSSTGITIHADGEEYAVAARYCSDYWLLKVNASGNIMWSKTYDGGIWDYLNYMTQTNDGGYILAGNTESFGAGEKYDAWLIKTDSNGNPQWNKTYGTGGFDGASGIVQTSDSGYMISGLFHPGYMGSYADAWLFKTDDAGNVLWDVKYGGYYADWGVRIERTSDEGYIMVGGTRSFGAGDGDAWLIRLAGLVHDVALTSVTPSKTVVGQGYSLNINVTATNQGDYTETFNVTEYYNLTGYTQPSGLVGCWKFDEGSSTTAYDSSGYNNDGILTNGPAWVNGKYGKALSFDGADDYVQVPHSSTLNSPNFTIEAWIYLNADIGNTQKRIVSKQETFSRSYSFDLFGNGYSGSTGNQLVLSIGNGAEWVNFMSDTKLSIKTWYHVVGTHEGTTSKIYINGQLDKSGTTTTQTTDNPAVLTIGCTKQTGDAPTFFFNGIIDEVRIYNRTLSQQEIVADMMHYGIIGTKTVTLTSGNSTTITFTWNTTGFAKGNYTLSAYAWPVLGETDTADNTLADGWIIVSMVGDITGPDGWPDGKCDMRDVRAVAKLFGINYPDQRYDPNCDINDDGKIDMKDVRAVAKEFGKTDP
jgi:hypothetical protein